MYSNIMDLFLSRTMVLLVLLFLFNIVTAIPEYFMEDHCSQTLALNFGGVEALRLKLVKAKTYPNSARCAMRIQAPIGKRLQLNIERFDIRGSPEVQCGTGDYVSLLDGPSEQAMPLSGISRRVCTKPVGSQLASSDRYMVVQFASDNDMVVGSGMSLVVTAFNDGPCTEGQFQCATNRRCIQKSLECDGTPNCGDASDEGLPKCLSTGAIVGIALGGAIILITIIVTIIVLTVGYIRRRRARTIRRAMVSEESPTTFYFSSHRMASIRNQLDPSALPDPIWDGNDNKGEVANGTTQSVNDNDISNAETLQQRRVSERKMSVKGPNGEVMTKVPSGYWDIPLSELYDSEEKEDGEGSPSTEI